MCVCLIVCIGPMCHPQVPSTLSLWDRVSRWNLRLSCWAKAVWPASNMGLPISVSSALGLQAHTTTAAFRVSAGDRQVDADLVLCPSKYLILLNLSTLDNCMNVTPILEHAVDPRVTFMGSHSRAYQNQDENSSLKSRTPCLAMRLFSLLACLVLQKRKEKIRTTNKFTFFKGGSYKTNWAWYHRLVISAFGKLTQEKFEASLGYMARTCLKYTKIGAGETAQQARALAALAGAWADA